MNGYITLVLFVILSACKTSGTSAVADGTEITPVQYGVDPADFSTVIDHLKGIGVDVRYYDVTEKEVIEAAQRLDWAENISKIDSQIKYLLLRKNTVQLVFVANNFANFAVKMVNTQDNSGKKITNYQIAFSAGVGRMQTVYLPDGSLALHKSAAGAFRRQLSYCALNSKLWQDQGIASLQNVKFNNDRASMKIFFEMRRDRNDNELDNIFFAELQRAMKTINKDTKVYLHDGSLQYSQMPEGTVKIDVSQPGLPELRLLK